MLDVQGLQSFVNSFEKEGDQDDVKQLNGSNILTYRTKINIILEQESLIDDMSTKFEKLAQLQNFQHFKFLQEMVNSSAVEQLNTSSNSGATVQQLKPIEINHLIQKQETAALVARVQGMLAQYNEIVKIVSQKFLYFDQLLGKYEQLVDKALVKQKEAIVTKAK